MTNTQLFARAQSDSRARKSVRTQTVIQAVLKQVLGEHASVHALEAHVEPSDSTLLRVCKRLDLDRLRLSVCQYIVTQLRSTGKLTHTLPSGRTIRPGSIDGTQAGGHWFGVFAYHGAHSFPVDVRSYDGLGRERDATHDLIADHADTTTHLLADGLYLEDDFFARCSEYNTHGVVKYTPNADAALPSLLQAARKRPAREHQTGYDSQRGVHYKLARTDVTHGGRRYTVLTRRTWADNETWVDGEVAYLVTTDTELEARDLYELSFVRWGIENDVFKALNDRVNHKASYIKDADTKHALLFLQCIGLVLYYLLELKCDGQAYEPGHFREYIKQWMMQSRTGRDPPELKLNLNWR